METDRSHSAWALRSSNSPLRTGVLLCVVATVCYLAAKLGGVLIITVPQTLWPLWPGCAVLVAILLLNPRTLWPLLITAGLTGFVVYDVEAGVPILSIAWLILSDILEILVASWGVSYVLNGRPRLSSLNALVKYVFLTVILASLVAASVGCFSMAGDRWISWRISLLSEGLAFLTLTPAILGWLSQSQTRRRASPAHYLEAVVLAALLIFLCHFVFVAREASPLPGLYSLVPFLLWSSLRFGLTGASTAASIVGLMSIWGAVHGRGPFTESDPINEVFALQLFLFFAAAPFLVLAVLVEERKNAEEAMRESRERLRLAAQAGRMIAYEWHATTDVMVRSPSVHVLAKDEPTHTSGQQILANCHPDDRERLTAAAAKLSPDNPCLEVRYRTIRPDGNLTWVEGNGRAYFDERGRMLRIIGMVADVTARKEAEQERSELSGRLIHAQEQERARIARELHDDLGQRTALLQIKLERLKQERTELSLGARQELQSILDLAEEFSSELHNLSHQLHPTRLDTLGLAAALEGLCREFSAQHHLRVQFVHQCAEGPVPKDVSLCLFRITQEALRNVVRHSGASQADVELIHCRDQIDLNISDAGAGFEPAFAARDKGLGLISMRERLRLVGGHLSIDSKASHGTRIQVRIPLTSIAEPDPAEAKKRGATA